MYNKCTLFAHAPSATFFTNVQKMYFRKCNWDLPQFKYLLSLMMFYPVIGDSRNHQVYLYGKSLLGLFIVSGFFLSSHYLQQVSGRLCIVG